MKATSETTIAWPTMLTVEHHNVERMNGVMSEAVLSVEHRIRIAGDPRHFRSAVDDQRGMISAVAPLAFMRLEAMVVASVIKHLRGAYGLDVAAHDMDWVVNALVARDGDRVPMHHHAHRDIVALYYPRVDAPSADDPRGLSDGALRFMDPRVWSRRWRSAVPGYVDVLYHAVVPEAGTLVIAPGYLQHETNPFHGPGVRITVGFFFNLRSR